MNAFKNNATYIHKIVKANQFLFLEQMLMQGLGYNDYVHLFIEVDKYGNAIEGTRLFFNNKGERIFED